MSPGTKRVVLIIALLVFFAAPHAFAQSTFVPLAPIPGLTQGATADTAGLATFFNNLYKYLIGIAAALAVIMIIWGGLEYSTQDSVSKKSDGKERIYHALFGLVLVLAPVLVFSIINPSILNLSINLQKLDTATTPTPPGNGNGTCDPVTNSDNAACRQQLIDACRARGGNPQQSTDIVGGRTVTTITCVTSGPLAPGSPMTIEQCTGQPTNGAGVPTLTSRTCAGFTATELAGRQCRNLTPEQGVCLWRQ